MKSTTEFTVKTNNYLNHQNPSQGYRNVVFFCLLSQCSLSCRYYGFMLLSFRRWQKLDVTHLLVSEPILLWRCSFSHHYVALFWAYSLVTLFVLSPLCGAALSLFSCDVVRSLTTMWRCSEPILLWRCSFSHHYVALSWAYSLVTLFVLSPLCGAVLSLFSCDVVHSLTTMWRCSEPILLWRCSFSHHYVALFWAYSLVTLFILSPLRGAVMRIFCGDVVHSLPTIWRCSGDILWWRCSFSPHYVALFWRYSVVTLFILSPLCGAVLGIFCGDVVHSLTTMWRCSEPILLWHCSFSHH